MNAEKRKIKWNDIWDVSVKWRRMFTIFFLWLIHRPRDHRKKTKHKKSLSHLTHRRCRFSCLLIFPSTFSFPLVRSHIGQPTTKAKQLIVEEIETEIFDESMVVWCFLVFRIFIHSSSRYSFLLLGVQRNEVNFIDRFCSFFFPFLLTRRLHSIIERIYVMRK